MLKLKRIRGLILFALLFVVVLGTGGGCATVSPSDDPRLLFLLSSDQGTLLQKDDGNYEFTMIDPLGPVVQFTDRPFREVASTPLVLWVASWGINGFEEIPPNAAITMNIKGVEDVDEAIMELFDPRILPDGSLQFDATFLKLEDGQDAFYPAIEGSGIKPNFFHTEVFIDSANIPSTTDSQQRAQLLLPRPVKGMCYVPAPSNYKTSCAAQPDPIYFDSDFYNEDFKQLWGTSVSPSRGDLQKMAGLHVNFLHLYDWNLPSARDHLPFLAEVLAKGMKVAVPISNFYVDQQNKAWVDEIIDEVMTYDPPAVVMWAIGNEPDTTDQQVADRVATIINWIYTRDKSRLITVPLALPFDAKLKALKTALDAKNPEIWKKNFIASINIYDDAAAVQVHVDDFGILFPTVPLVISEMNRPLSQAGNNPTQQADEMLQQFEKSKNLVADGKHPHFFGSYVFQWMVKPWACPPDDEKHYGINDFSGSLGTGTTTSGQSYPIDGLLPNLLYDSVMQAFQ